MGDFLIGTKSVLTQSGSAEPVLASTLTGAPAISLDNATAPAWLVQASAMSNLATGADAVLDYDTVIQNVGGGTFNTTLGTNSYTAPVSGLYQINVSAHYEGFPNNVTDFRIKIVTSNRTYERWYGKFINAEHSTNWAGTFDFSQLVDLDASDTCVIKVYQNAGSAAADLTAAHSYFSGFLVSKY